MTLVDWIIVVVLAAAVLGGIARGFFRSAFSLAGLILGLALAAWNYWRLAALMKPLIHSVEVAECDRVPGDCACGDGGSELFLDRCWPRCLRKWDWVALTGWREGLSVLWRVWSS